MKAMPSNLIMEMEAATYAILSQGMLQEVTARSHTQSSQRFDDLAKKKRRRRRRRVKWNEWKFQTGMWQYSISVFNEIPADLLSQTCSRALLLKSLHGSLKTTLFNQLNRLTGGRRN